MVAEGHLLARADIANADDFAAPGLQGRVPRSQAHLRVLYQEVELLLTIADIILIKAIVEIIACVLGANVEWSIHVALAVLLAGLSGFLLLFLLLCSL